LLAYVLGATLSFVTEGPDAEQALIYFVNLPKASEKQKTESLQAQEPVLISLHCL